MVIVMLFAPKKQTKKTIVINIHKIFWGQLLLLLKTKPAAGYCTY